jgi:mannan endo-1,4-beta-mannosidase
MRNISLTIIGLLLFSAVCSCKKKDIAPDVSGLHIKDGKYLVDGCGNKVVLRGVNMGSIYAVNFGIKELEEIEKTGSNSVRIVLEQQYKDYSLGGVLTNINAANLEPIVNTCLAKGMIPIIELHDFTGTGSVSTDLLEAVSWWKKADIREMLFKYQKSIILNIANEPDNGNATADEYSTVNITAVRSLRNAGYICPIMIDAPGWGKDHSFFVTKGKALMNADPLHSLIFSVHAYWPTNGPNGNYSDAKIIQNMNELKGSGLPITIGELAIADVQGGMAYNINYKLVMKLCQENEFGYLVWWWGFNNNPNANNQLSMTNNGLFSGLQVNAKVIAIDDANSIKRTSIKICQ